MRQRGFTLVEIMVVVMIMGILLMIAVPSWRKVRETTRTRACQDNLRLIRDAKLQWGMDKSMGSLSVPAAADLVPEYIKKVPVCQEGGTYTFNTLGDHCECSQHGPVL